MSNPYEQPPEAMVTGEKSIRFVFGSKVDKETYHKVLRFCKSAEQNSASLFEEIVPSYRTVTVYLKKEMKNPDLVIEGLLTKWMQSEESQISSSVRKLHIPVCYDEEFSLDMERMMNHTKLCEKEIISLHSGHTYTVYMIGFLPGFPYLGELNEKLTTPRLHTPRLKVPKGTVGIGGSQTGIYPLDCLGGWNILGKTPLDIYRPDRAEPFFIEAGDQLEFLPITMPEFHEMNKQMEKHPEAIKEFIVEEQ